MSEIKTITTEELEKLKELRNKYDGLSYTLGQIRIEQHLLDTQVNRLKEAETQLIKDYATLQAEEKALADEITKKYGQGQINIETGEFTPSV
jgi:predicted nuclease with TOPRIM domain